MDLQGTINGNLLEAQGQGTAVTYAGSPLRDVTDGMTVTRRFHEPE